uniref:Uncharacterized protein n=1 Tax=Phenylobacterium glaciei TaxID=2803784 RepID=A0A974P6E3_9CAUL|nr:hypothetical protein JKL49_19130 [Phenylobacterium glaciei]
MRKYGWPIGHARVDIEAGDHVHSHNLATNLSGLEEYRYLPSVAADMLAEDLTFDGYRRADGRVGILFTTGRGTPWAYRRRP